MTVQEFINPISAGYNWFYTFVYYLPLPIRACIFLVALYFAISSAMNLLQHIR